MIVFCLCRVHEVIFCRCHGDGLVSRRAYLRAGTAACAVHQRPAERELLVLRTLHRYCVCNALRFLRGHHERTNDGMRTNARAPVTLHTVLHVPMRKIRRDTALFVSRSTRRHHAGYGIHKLGNRNVVSGQIRSRYQNIV